MKKRHIIPPKTIILLFILAISYMLFDRVIFALNNDSNIIALFLWEFSYFIPATLAILINKIVKKKSSIEEKSVKIIKILFYIFSSIYVMLTLCMAIIMRAMVSLFDDVL